MTKQRIKNLLEERPTARKIKNKYKVLAYLTMEKYSLDIEKDKMRSIIEDVLRSDRYLRLIKQEQPHLRGDSEATKQLLETKAKIEHGI